MPVGGPRRAGPGKRMGRPPMALTKTSRDDAVEATKAVDLKPITVMAQNMRFWYDIAMNLTSRVKQALESEQFIQACVDNPDLIKDLNDSLKRMLIAREKAQECAVDMAPYRHPRLANIEVHAGFGEDDEPKVPLITHDTSPEDAARRYKDLLGQRV